jgi:hypothetical protein
MEEMLQQPMRGVKMASDLNLPVGTYPELCKPPLILSDDQKSFIPATLYGIPFPRLFPSDVKFRENWKKVKENFKIEHCGNESVPNGYMWNVNDVLKFITSNEIYSNYISDKENLNIIIRGDGGPVGGGHFIFMIMTLDNFGILSKSLEFNFLINLAEVNEKNREEVRAAFLKNLDTIDMWKKEGYVRVYENLDLKVKIDFGGDDSWLRMLLGFLSAKELMACLHCLWKRGESYNEIARVDRVFSILRHFNNRDMLDSQAPPMIQHAQMKDFHNDGMHGIIPFGKDILARCRFHLASLASSSIENAANTWLKKHQINYVDMR